MAVGNHPDFAPARVAIANERLAGIVMQPGMMLLYGLCKMGIVWPCSLDDLEAHTAWLESHGIPDSSRSEVF